MRAKRLKTTDCPVHCPTPLRIRHVDLEDNIQLSFLVWVLVHRHTLAANHDAVPRLQRLAHRIRHEYATAIQVREDYPRESEQRFRQCDVHFREQIIPRAFKGCVGSRLELEDDVPWRYAGLYNIVSF